ncbi:hypothetical protein SAMN04488570_1703 [Nocardioides scoriae]|uniref:Uncharacterized protein n=1 Tax=Nocardioides scoriae TaxID=642780 RepID=A0A1H1RJC1_9ACTN|nr:hypothetical protein [Nocardioides scoriae]SDS35798.1 hypothetical protein SAMN04488570_1703 [Nocardioides scoriae]
MRERHFNPAPGWPAPPQGWTPPADWQPDPAWPPAPAGWVWWVDGEGPDEPARSVQRRGYQLGWVVTYWSATGLSLLFLLLAVTTPDVPGSTVAALGFGSTAALAGSTLATLLRRAGVAAIDFDDATAPMRVLAAAWAVLLVAMLVAVAVGTGWGARDSAGPEATSSVLSVADRVAAQIFGVAALFVVVGDGYTKHRRLLGRA